MNHMVIGNCHGGCIKILFIKMHEKNFIRGLWTQCLIKGLKAGISMIHI